jgi:hypothetical protein
MQGLGNVTAPTILAAVGTPQRFHSQAAFRGWTGVVPHASQSADDDEKGLPMTKAGPRRVKLALYQAAEVARQWDPQLAEIYYDQMVHEGKPHHKAMGTVMSHLASCIHAVLTEQRDYILRDVDGREVTAAEARTIVKTQYQAPTEIRAARRTNRRRKRDVSTDQIEAARSAPHGDRRLPPTRILHSRRRQIKPDWRRSPTDHRPFEGLTKLRNCPGAATAAIESHTPARPSDTPGRKTGQGLDRLSP